MSAYIEKTPKILKEMVNVTKDAKNIFGPTFLFDDGLITFAPETIIDTRGMSKSLHIGITDYKFFDTKMPPMRVYGANIYRLDKHIKKNIKGFNITDDGDINADIVDVEPDDMIITENKQKVKMTNEIATINTGDVVSVPAAYRQLMNWNRCHDRVRLTSEDVENLVKNKTYTVSWHGITTRITRSVIPGLKKNHEVEAMYTDNIEEITGSKPPLGLYVLWLRVKRETMTTLHGWLIFNTWGAP